MDRSEFLKPLRGRALVDRLQTRLTLARERKDAAQSLRDSEERTRIATEAAGFGIFAWDVPNDQATLKNPRVHEIIGRRPEAAPLRKQEFYDQYLDQADVERFEAALAEAMTGKPFAAQCRIRRGTDGALRWIEFSGRFRFAPDGSPLKLVGVVADITERRSTEEALRQSERRHRLLTQLNDAIRPLTDSHAIVLAAMRVLREHIGADRCAWAEIEEDESHFVFVDMVCAPGVAPVSGRYRLDAFGSEAPGYIRAGEAFVWNGEGFPDGASAEAYAAMGLRGLCAAPLHRGGRLVAGIGVHSLTPRDWTDEEVGIIRDVTERCWESIERARTELQLRRSHDTFFNLVANAPFGVYVVDQDLKLIQTSGGSREVFSNVDPAVGRDLLEGLRIVWTEPFATQAYERFRHTLETGEPYHSADTIQRRNDVDAIEAYDWRIARVQLPDGRYGVVCYFYDMTRRLRAEEALRESEARYRHVVESQSEMICRFKPSGEILFANAAYARSQGMTPEELVGRTFWEFVPQTEWPALEAMVAGLTAQTPERRHENRFTTADGERWTLWTNQAIAFDADGRCLEAQSSGIDISDRKRAEEHRKLLLDELNHRVKNTLAVVQGIAQQTFKGTTSIADARRAFEGRLATLASAHGLLTRTNWERAPIRVLAEEAVAGFGADPARVDLDGPPLTLSPKKAISVAMALHELGTNAVKYGALSNDLGRVIVRWRIVPEDQPTIEVVWREEGGPPVTPPTRRGFGSMIIEKALAYEIRGEVSVDYKEDGVVCTIRAPLIVNGP